MRTLRNCCLLLALTGCGEPLFLMFEERIETSEGTRFVGAGCHAVDGGTSSGGVGGGAQAPAYSIEHQADGESVRVTVRGADGRALAVRNYGETFLLSDRVDEFEVEVDPQHTLQLRYWGGTTCEDPAVPE